MKKKEYIAAAVILFIALAVAAANYLFNGEAHKLQITMDGEVYGTYALDQNQEIKIGDTNVCAIREGRVSMTEADCPDQICVHTADISKAGGSIVCLPNRIVLEIISEDGSMVQPETDSISS
ncbi:MAG: NusG domain II-containing protein [Clostridiales bacterium]|nr:NusG domain II-containing protein [Clostridiales bacterium]